MSLSVRARTYVCVSRIVCWHMCHVCASLCVYDELVIFGERVERIALINSETISPAFGLQKGAADVLLAQPFSYIVSER